MVFHDCMLLSLYISSLIYTAWSESLSYAVVYTALLLCGQAMVLVMIGTCVHRNRLSSMPQNLYCEQRQASLAVCARWYYSTYR